MTDAMPEPAPTLEQPPEPASAVVEEAPAATQRGVLTPAGYMEQTASTSSGARVRFGVSPFTAYPYIVPLESVYWSATPIACPISCASTPSSSIPTQLVSPYTAHARAGGVAGSRQHRRALDALDQISHRAARDPHDESARGRAAPRPSSERPRACRCGARRRRAAPRRSPHAHGRRRRNATRDPRPCRARRRWHARRGPAQAHGYEKRRGRGEPHRHRLASNDGAPPC